MAFWLYPISRKAERFFRVGRREIPVSANSFRDLVRSGRITGDRLWSVNQGFKVAKPGDDIFIYAGRSDGDRGIIGVGKIWAIRWVKSWESWAFDIRIDLEKSNELI